MHVLELDRNPIPYWYSPDDATVYLLRSSFKFDAHCRFEIIVVVKPFCSWLATSSPPRVAEKFEFMTDTLVAIKSSMLLNESDATYLGILSIPDGLTNLLGWVLHSSHAHCIMGHFLNALSVAPISLL